MGIAYSLRPDLKGSLQRSGVNLLCILGVCAFPRPKVFSSCPAGTFFSPSPALPPPPPSSIFHRWAPLFVRLGGVEATLRARSTVEIRADQRWRPGTTDVPRCVRAFGLLRPTEGIDDGTAHPALQWESAQGLRLPSLALDGGQSQPLGAGRGGRRGDRQLTQGSGNVCL